VSKATRRILPACEEEVRTYKENGTVTGREGCGQPASTAWYWLSVSDEPFYVCKKHDEILIKEEEDDERERKIFNRSNPEQT
jgi:hypothetical protein